MRPATAEQHDLLVEVVEQAAASARLLNVSTLHTMGIIRADGPGTEKPAAQEHQLLRAMYLTAGLRLGMSLECIRATLPEAATSGGVRRGVRFVGFPLGGFGCVSHFGSSK
jgi:hypothetical protein